MFANVYVRNKSVGRNARILQGAVSYNMCKVMINWEDWDDGFIQTWVLLHAWVLCPFMFFVINAVCIILLNVSFMSWLLMDCLDVNLTVLMYCLGVNVIVVILVMWM